MASPADIDAIAAIYNEGIEDGIATLEYPTKSLSEMSLWLADHGGRYPVIVATDEADEDHPAVTGWAALNRYSHRCAYDGVADLSVYVRRDKRGCGVGAALMEAIEQQAAVLDFHKIVLFMLADNTAGRRLYERRGFREVGVFIEQGKLDGRFVDVVSMEKLLKIS